MLNYFQTELINLRESCSRLSDSKSRYRATFSKIHVISAEFEQRLGTNNLHDNSFTDLSKFEEVEDLEDLQAGEIIMTKMNLTLAYISYWLFSISSRQVRTRTLTCPWLKCHLLLMSNTVKSCVLLSIILGILKTCLSLSIFFSFFRLFHWC